MKFTLRGVLLISKKVFNFFLESRIPLVIHFLLSFFVLTFTVFTGQLLCTWKINRSLIFFRSGEEYLVAVYMEAGLAAIAVYDNCRRC